MPSSGIPNEPRTGIMHSIIPSKLKTEDQQTSSILIENFSGMPQAFDMTTGYDRIVDEGEDYAKRLIEVGIPVTQ